VASSGSRHRVELSLTLTGLRARFGDRVVTADDVARGKPDPAIFLRSARVQGADPARCLVVEDSALGIEAARRAGMRAVGVSTLTAPEDLADASEGVVFSMDELLAALA
jgi:beta-phosphoglucomutase-like phosphatase (HAD superfamily)